MPLPALLLRSALLLVLVSAANGQTAEGGGGVDSSSSSSTAGSGSSDQSLQDLLSQYQGLYAGLIVPGALLVLGTLCYVFKPSLQRWATSCSCCGLCSLGCCVRKAVEAEQAAETVERDGQMAEKDIDAVKEDRLPEQLRITVADSSHGHAAAAHGGHHSRPPSRARSQPQKPSQQHSQHQHSRRDVAATEPSSPSSAHSGNGSEETYDSYLEKRPTSPPAHHHHQSHAAHAATSRTPPPQQHSLDSLHPFRQSRGVSAPARSGSPLPSQQLSPQPQLSPASAGPSSPAQSPVEVQLAALRSDWQEEKLKQLTHTVDVMALMLKLQQDNMALTQQLAQLRLQQSVSAPAAVSSPQQPSSASPQSGFLSPLSLQAPLMVPLLPAQPHPTVQTTQPLPRSLPPASPTPVLYLPLAAQHASMTPSASVTNSSSSNAASPSSDDQRASTPVFHHDGEEEEDEKEAEAAAMRAKV